MDYELFRHEISPWGGASESRSRGLVAGSVVRFQRSGLSRGVEMCEAMSQLKLGPLALRARSKSRLTGRQAERSRQVALNASEPKDCPPLQRSQGLRPSPLLSIFSSSPARNRPDPQIRLSGHPTRRQNNQLVNRRSRTLFTNPSSINVASKFDPP